MRNRKFIIVVTLGKNGIQEEHIWGFKNISHIPLIKPNGEKGSHWFYYSLYFTRIINVLSYALNSS